MVQLVNTSIHKVKTTPETNEYISPENCWLVSWECKIRHVGDSKLSNWDSHENLGHRNSPATAFFLKSDHRSVKYMSNWFRKNSICSDQLTIGYFIFAKNIEMKYGPVI